MVAPVSQTGLRVASSCGLGEEGDRELNAYLGVSFSKTKYFSTAMMRRYMRWSCEHFQDLLLIVADHLEAYNAQVFKGVSHAEAELSTRASGVQYLRAYERARPQALRSRIRLCLASDLVAEPACGELVERVRAVVRSDQAFAGDIRQTVRDALGHKLDSLPPRRRERQDAIEVLMGYLTEEIGIILFLTARSDPIYHVSIFPYPPPRILVELYSGRYADRFADLTGRRPYRAVELLSPA